MLCLLFFFFKQKTAYEMRISDWSSDVCSSDLVILDVLPALNLHGVLPQVVGLLIAVPADLLLTKDLVGHKHVFDDLIPLAVAEGHINSDVTPRSEEHPSELQSLMRTPYAAFCLKKNNTTTNTAYIHCAKTTCCTIN